MRSASRTKIIYLHGFASGPSSKKARHFEEKLRTEGIRLEVPDLSEGDFEHLTITGQLGVVERLAGGEPASLIGSSMGGYLAALYAARRPEVQKVALLAPAFGFARRWTQSMGTAATEEWKRTGWLKQYHYAEGNESRVWYQLIEDGLKYEDYPDVKQPALVFHGTGDTVVRPEWSQEFAAGRANARLVLVDSDHELVNVLDRMWTESREFLLGE